MSILGFPQFAVSGVYWRAGGHASSPALFPTAEGFSMPDSPSISVSPMPLSMTRLEWGLLFLLSFLWGGSFFFIELALRDLPLFTIGFARLFFATLGLYAVMAFMGLSLPKSRSGWLACFFLGFVNNALPFSLLIWGQKHIDSGIAAILISTTPLFTLVCAHFFSADEKMTAGRFFGIVMGICGVALMLAPGIGGGARLPLVACLACLGTAFCYGISGVFARRFLLSKNPPVSAATGQVLTAAILLLPFVLFLEQPWTLPMPRASSWAALIAMGLFSTALAYTLYFRILVSAGAMNLSLVSLLIPANAVLLGIFVLNEQFLLNHVAGMTLILLSLTTLDARLLRRLASAVSPRNIP